MATKSPTTTTTTDTAPVTDTAQTEVIKAPAAPAAPAAPTPFDGLPQELFRLSVDGSLLQVEAKIDGGWVIAAEFNMIGRNSPVLLTRSDLGV